MIFFKLQVDPVIVSANKSNIVTEETNKKSNIPKINIVSMNKVNSDKSNGKFLLLRKAFVKIHTSYALQVLLSTRQNASRKYQQQPRRHQKEVEVIK